MTIRLDRATLRRLEKLARATSRTKAFHAQQAIHAYVEQNEWQLAAIEEGLRAADRGAVVEHERVEQWLATWGSAREQEPPECE